MPDPLTPEREATLTKLQAWLHERRNWDVSVLYRMMVANPRDAETFSLAEFRAVGDVLAELAALRTVSVRLERERERLTGRVRELEAEIARVAPFLANHRVAGYSFGPFVPAATANEGT